VVNTLPSANSPTNVSDGGSSTSLGVEVRGVAKAFGGTQVLHDIELSVEPGAMVALIGPSGCGKTTLLRIIAGLETPDQGEVQIGSRVVFSASDSVPPERRRVGMVFQDWALFPHLSVAKNVAYGLARSDRRRERIEGALAMVGLAGLGDRMPTTLSGGQQQRVALARAVAPEPAVLLLDEPFSNLDASLRAQVRTEVHELLVRLGITTVFVTHDQDEAFVLGDEVAVMRGGRIEQQATPAELYAHPASPWVAGFVGDANLVDGVADGGVATTALGALALDAPVEGLVQVLVRPEEVVLDEPTGGGAPATVELVEFYGHDTVYLLRLDDGGALRARAGSAPRFGRGDAVTCRYAGRPTRAYPRR
jgi:iron(III) transport system ATP-binding protein